jgi:hypothetical protein
MGALTNKIIPVGPDAEIPPMRLTSTLALSTRITIVYFPPNPSELIRKADKLLS